MFLNGGLCTVGSRSPSAALDQFSTTPALVEPRMLLHLSPSPIGLPRKLYLFFFTPRAHVGNNGCVCDQLRFSAVKDEQLSKG